MPVVVADEEEKPRRTSFDRVEDDDAEGSVVVVARGLSERE